jgi:hypothetical protein
VSSYPEQLPPAGVLSDDAEDMDRMFTLIEIHLRAASTWSVEPSPSTSPSAEGDVDSAP